MKGYDSFTIFRWQWPIPLTMTCSLVSYAICHVHTYRQYNGTWSINQPLFTSQWIRHKTRRNSTRSNRWMDNDRSRLFITAGQTADLSSTEQRQRNFFKQVRFSISLLLLLLFPLPCVVFLYRFFAFFWGRLLLLFFFLAWRSLWFPMI